VANVKIKKCVISFDDYFFDYNIAPIPYIIRAFALMLPKLSQLEVQIQEECQDSDQVCILLLILYFLFSLKQTRKNCLTMFQELLECTTVSSVISVELAFSQQLARFSVVPELFR
jgi:adenosine deaminase